MTRSATACFLMPNMKVQIVDTWPTPILPPSTTPMKRRFDSKDFTSKTRMDNLPSRRSGAKFLINSHRHSNRNDGCYAYELYITHTPIPRLLVPSQLVRALSEPPPPPAQNPARPPAAIRSPFTRSWGTFISSHSCSVRFLVKSYM